MKNIFQVTEVDTTKKKPGYNIRHITRVTGYMSYVESWNPGKRSELNDRHRVEMGKETASLFSWYPRIG